MGLFSPALNNKPDDHSGLPAYQNLNLKKRMGNGYKLYWMAVGRDDVPVLLAGIQDFRKKMDTVGTKYEFKETDGGHT